MKKFLLSLIYKPTLYTIFFIFGIFSFLGAGYYYFFIDTNYLHSVGGIFGFSIAICLIPLFLLYRFIIKRFETKNIFKAELISVVLFSILFLVSFISKNRHLVIDLTNYSDNYFIAIDGNGELKNTKTHPTLFFINNKAVVQDNYIVLDNYDLFHSEIKYPKSWKKTEFDDQDIIGDFPSASIQIESFVATIFYNDAFELSSRTFDSLATLIIYAKKNEVSVNQANIELVNIWAEIDYLNTTHLVPFTKNSIPQLHYSLSDQGLSDSDDSYAIQESYDKWIKMNETATLSDNGIYLSYTSYERLIDDMNRRAELNNWPVQTINELTAFYNSRMAEGFFSLYIERPTKELANTKRFQLNGDYYFGKLQPNPAHPSFGSDSAQWTNTLIIPVRGVFESTFQVTVEELFGEDEEPDTFTFAMKKN